MRINSTRIYELNCSVNTFQGKYIGYKLINDRFDNAYLFRNIYLNGEYITDHLWIYKSELSSQVIENEETLIPNTLYDIKGYVYNFIYYYKGNKRVKLSLSNVTNISIIKDSIIYTNKKIIGRYYSVSDEKLLFYDVKSNGLSIVPYISLYSADLTNLSVPPFKENYLYEINGNISKRLCDNDIIEYYYSNINKIKIFSQKNRKEKKILVCPQCKSSTILRTRNSWRICTKCLHEYTDDYI